MTEIAAQEPKVQILHTPEIAGVMLSTDLLQLHMLWVPETFEKGKYGSKHTARTASHDLHVA